MNGFTDMPIWANKHRNIIVESLEQRVAMLEFQVLEHYKMEILLFNLLLQNQSMRPIYVEALRRILQNPVEGQPLSHPIPHNYQPSP